MEEELKRAINLLESIKDVLNIFADKDPSSADALVIKHNVKRINNFLQNVNTPTTFIKYFEKNKKNE